VRLEGTNAAQGRTMLQESGLDFTTASTMAEAAEAAVRLASGR